MKDPSPRESSVPEIQRPIDAEPRWPAILAVVATAALHFVLPEPFRFGPGWLLLVVVLLFLIPIILTHRAGRLKLNRILGHIVLGSLTASMVWSLTMLI